MVPFWRKKYQERPDKTECIVKNGEILLEKLITTFNGKRNPISNYASEELNLATDRYRTINVMFRDAFYKLYRANLSDRQISVMKFHSYKFGANSPQKDEIRAYQCCINNIVFAAQMRHKNILQLLGCCLETETPILVFQSAECDSLACRIYHHDEPTIEPILWMQRLKIAMEIAHAIAYLHTGFPRPIVFRNIVPSNILFDEECVAKLFDFSLAILIPEGETYVFDAVRGTIGFIAPEYYKSGCCDERCDVYSFGALLIELLTGQRMFALVNSNFRLPDADPVPAGVSNLIEHCRFDLFLHHVNKFIEHMLTFIEHNKIKEMVDPTILGDIQSSEKEQQLQAFADLAIKCFSPSPENRPTMVDAAKQLKELYRSCICH